MNASRSVVTGDVVVRGSKIVQLGGRADVGPAHVIDASGCIVVPGLVQAHVHLCQALFRGLADDLPLLDWLRKRIWPLEAAHNRRSLAASARLGLAEMLLSGTTTILDMGTVHHQDEVFDAMAESGIRGLSGKAMMDAGNGVPDGLLESTETSVRQSIALQKRWHGKESGRLGYAFAPRFILSCSDGLLRHVADLSRETGCLIHSHAAEHAEEQDIVRKKRGKTDVMALADLGISGSRVVLAHGVQLDKNEMKVVAGHGTRFVHCPSANLKLASGIADVCAMRAAGIVVALGADGAPCNNRMDPWTELRQAALLAKVRRNDASALPAHEAFAMATIDGARALGWNELVGSVEVGKLADIVVVDRRNLHAMPHGDVMSFLVYACTPNDVRHVMVDGRIVVRNGELQTLDVDQVRADANRESVALLRRAKLD